MSTDAGVAAAEAEAAAPSGAAVGLAVRVAAQAPSPARGLAVAAADDLEIGTFFTVNGFVPDPTRTVTMDSLRYAERYQWQGEATTPRMAEDLAREQLREEGLERGFDAGHAVLFVTSVFEGRVKNVDNYARFLDPDIMGTD
jgi:hypothetical protein